MYLARLMLTGLGLTGIVVRRAEAAKTLADDERVSAAVMTGFVRKSNLAKQDRRTIADLASKLTKKHKWPTPYELESGEIKAKGPTV
jgi:hypothetical protein